MALASPAWPHRDDVLTAQDVFAAGQLQDEHFVQRRDRHEVEAIEALHHREACGPDPLFHRTALALDEFQLGKPQKITRMIDVTRPGSSPKASAA